jgi:hypothetical protein
MRNGTSINVVIASTVVGGLAFWAVWVVAFVGVVPFLTRGYGVRESTAIMGMNVGAAVSGAFVSWIGLLVAGRVRRTRVRFGLAGLLLAWVASSVLPGFLYPRFSLIPPHCFLFQVPLVFGTTLLILLRREPRG